MSPTIGLIFPVLSLFIRGDGYDGIMNPSSVSSIKPAVVLTLSSESVLFCNSNVGLKNKIKNALTKMIVTIILNIMFTICEYYSSSSSLISPSFASSSRFFCRSAISFATISSASLTSSSMGVSGFSFLRRSRTSAG
jgi:hypothetical protein